MVWTGVRAHGKTSLMFINKKATYIQKVLFFVRKDVPCLFPGELKSIMMDLRDRASCHLSIWTMQYLDDADINHVAPGEWRPKSPDTGSMDYSLCCIQTRELQKKSKRALAGPKLILKMAWNDPTKDVIDRALRSWLKTYHQTLQTYYKHLSHIKSC